MKFEKCNFQQILLSTCFYEAKTMVFDLTPTAREYEPKCRRAPKSSAMICEPGAPNASRRFSTTMVRSLEHLDWPQGGKNFFSKNCPFFEGDFFTFSMQPKGKCFQCYPHVQTTQRREEIGKLVGKKKFEKKIFFWCAGPPGVKTTFVKKNQCYPLRILKIGHRLKNIGPEKDFKALSRGVFFRRQAVLAPAKFF